MNLLEIGKIVRPHGIKGAVKIVSYIDENFSAFKKIYIGQNSIEANISKVASLNNDAFSVTLDIINSVEEAEKLRNKTVYINRDDYAEFKDKIYLSDLINSPVLNEKDEQIGEMVDYDDYGASVILTIKCGAVSYSIPFVEEIIEYSKTKQAFVIEEQKFKDMRV